MKLAAAVVSATLAVALSAQDCTRKPITIPTTDDLKLPGMLTLPASTKRLPPVAVLEQGSGVQDMDATIGANKFFVQLADGLCARGVATIRFDRRAKVSTANFMAHADLDHEIVIDAAAAMAFAQTLPEVDPAQVFLVGHSLGAQLSPDSVALRLRQKPGSVHGMALLSGVARPINIVLDEQIRTLGATQGATPEQLAQAVARYDAIFAKAGDPATPPTEKVGGLPASYWRDWLRRDPAKTMATLHLPILVTRGTKDVNAPHADFALLSAAATTPGSAAHEFAGLNHLYFAISGEPNGMDVMTANTVSPEFLDYLADWLRHPSATPAAH